jgi:FlaA1/EpsC-like NDP-sugar epimerase/lipopolysaccharide/colanic/teichoic acid biosynthesis glycosyltransferase
MIKRGLDILGALVGLVLFSPVFLAMALAIKLTSRGPALFRQARVGLHGRPFRVLKFRTMVEDAERRGGPVTTLSDPRVTRLGRVLRRYKLDELPQFWNVLKGEMSLVGPRPEVPEMVATFTPEQRQLLEVRPGLVDYAAIAYEANADLLDRADDPVAAYATRVLPRKIELNLRYLQRRGLREDLRILLATLVVLAQSLLSRLGKPGQMVVDAAVVAASLLAAYQLRFEFAVPPQHWKQMVFLLPYVVLARLGFNLVFRIYKIIWSYISLYEMGRFFRSVLSLSGLLLAARLAFADGNPYLVMPFSVIVLEGTFSLLGMVSVRFTRRWLHELTRSGLAPLSENARKVLIVGAGDLGRATAKEIRLHTDLDLAIVGMIDDDAAKTGSLLEGVRVLGTLDDLPALYERLRFNLVLLAIAELPRARKRHLSAVCEELRVPLKVVTGASALISGDVQVSEFRNVQIEDLLGRPVRELAADDPLLLPVYGNRRVLVTGAGGSIGSEICRQLCSLNPARLVLVDKDENNLFYVRGELARRFPRVPVEPCILDVRARDKLERLFERVRPEVVLHAAAYKHVPLMEENPFEAVENNILGTRNVAEVAAVAGVGRFVMISTDKAVNPTSIMGATKRVAELIVRSLAEQGTGTRFACVRFGNVLGSRGSVIPTFEEQIRRGGPVTVTHADVTRYFMTIPEASQLVLKAGTLADRGEVFVLDMGEPVRILDLARDMIRLSGRTEADVPIQIVGLRPGEKLYEELLLASDDILATALDKVFVAKPELRDLATFRAQVEHLVERSRAGSRAEVRALLAGMDISFREADGG